MGEEGFSPYAVTTSYGNRGAVLRYFCAAYWAAQHEGHAGHDNCVRYAMDETHFYWGWLGRDPIDVWFDSICRACQADGDLEGDLDHYCP